ncbi:MAG: DNA cytosine methyltransferase [Xenococcaceae cyanobacterium]
MLDLFAGCGGFSLAAHRLGGIQTTQFVEINPDAQTVLRSASLPAKLIAFPIYPHPLRHQRLPPRARRI